MTILLPQHLADLRRSGLSDATIQESGIHSSTDPEAVGRILNWRWPAWGFGPCMVIPFRDPASGELNGFARVKPDKPRKDSEGKACRYEQPRAAGLRCFFPVRTLAAAREPGALLGFTEGEKKSLAADQAGRPCIGLTGVFAWTSGKDATGERKLIDDLSWIDWNARPVWICFDTDPTRNPNVAHARAELARVLTDRGANLYLIDLPVGPRDANGLPTKNAVDDYIAANGEAAFRDLLDRQISAAADNPRPLTEIRMELATRRVESIEAPGLYVDRSPPGAGKTIAGAAAMRKANRSLIVVATHRNAKEISETFAAIDDPITVVPFPKLCPQNCENFEEAADAIEAGLSPSQAVCLSCQFRGGCDYVESMAEAQAAACSVTTHKRASLTGGSIICGKNFVVVEEDPIGIFKPMEALSGGLDTLIQVALIAKQSAAFARNDSLLHFFDKMEQAARLLREALEEAPQTAEIPLPTGAGRPVGIDQELFRAIKLHGRRPSREVVRVCRAIAAGDLSELAVRVDEIRGDGGQLVKRRSIVATWQTRFPKHAAVWCNDGTGSPAEISAAAGQPIIDATPAGSIEQKHPTLQIPIDIKKSTAPSVVIDTLAGVLNAFPTFQRVGLIIDQDHIPAVIGTARGPRLDPAFRGRLEKIEHYRSGESRGSNDFIERCDSLIVFGTPRTSPQPIKDRLVQIGRTAAAARDGKWGPWWWSGMTVSGKRQTIRTLGYRDRDWDEAFQSVVTAELEQAIGRGRTICDTGLPTVVVSCEELGLKLVDFSLQTVSSAELETLRTVAKLSEQFSKGLSESETADYRTSFLKSSTLEFCSVSSVSSEAVAKALDMTDRYARKLLARLADAGLVERVGQRGGWRLTEKGAALIAGGESDERPDEKSDEKSGDGEGENASESQGENQKPATATTGE